MADIYVASAGADYTSLSAALAAASAGDNIYLNGGEVFTESSTITSTLDNITISSYGTGKPILRYQNGLISTAWADQGGGIYLSNHVVTAVNILFETATDGSDPVLLKHVETYGDLANPGEIYWDKANGQGGGDGFYWIPSTGSPATRKVYINNNSSLLYMPDVSGVTINNIQFDYASLPLYIRANTKSISDITVTDCDFSNILMTNFRAESTYSITNLTITGCTFTDCLKHAIFTTMANSTGQLINADISNNTITNVNVGNSFEWMKDASNGNITLNIDLEAISLQNMLNCNISQNEIYNVEATTTGAGAIVCWANNTVAGIEQGNVIDRNFIYNIYGAAAPADCKGLVVFATGVVNSSINNSCRNNILIGSGVGEGIDINNAVTGAAYANEVVNNTIYGFESSIDIGASSGSLIVARNLSIPTANHLYATSLGDSAIKLRNNRWYPRDISTLFGFIAGTQKTYATYFSLSGYTDDDSTITKPWLVSDTPTEAAHCYPRSNSTLLTDGDSIPTAVDYFGNTPASAYVGAVSTLYSGDVAGGGKLRKTWTGRR